MEPLVKQVLEMNGCSKEEIDELPTDFWIIYEEKLKETRDLVVNDNQYVYACLILEKYNRLLNKTFILTSSHDPILSYLI
jgi:hypothetical protein